MNAVTERGSIVRFMSAIARNFPKNAERPETSMRLDID
jgi:hypothetical protein